MSEKSLPPLTVVLGGVSSGKSSVAEGLVIKSTLPRHYIATAQAFDDEMRAKIADHKIDRGPDWITHEAPLDVAQVLNSIPQGTCVLLDCATMWLTNVMMADAEINAATDELLSALRNCAAPVVVVSNEVGLGGVPANAMARRFARLQGGLNAQLAAQADSVLLVTAGLPQVLK